MNKSNIFMMLTRLSTIFILVFIVMALSACAQKGIVVNKYAPPAISKKEIEPKYNGAIYQEGMPVNMFYDTTAHGIGDILMINLVESATALSSKDTVSEKKQKVEMDAPKIAGGDVTSDGKKVLENNLEANRDFRGSGESNQSHSFQAMITVSVVDVLPNSYLVVRGEKLIRINQSEDYIRFSGIVRPQDISTDNVVESQKVANVQISYSGNGPLSNANEMGPLAKFFNSQAYPY
jgi:flagellar L-ring protein precursor FlgH